MAFYGLQVTEIFHSIQGETSLSGVRFAFIRLTGCNLRCTYCDTTYAFKGGTARSIEEILAEIRPWEVKHVLVTGGEPLLQRNTPALVRALRDAGYLVSIETHGEAPIENVVGLARIILDIKTPGSKMNRGQWRANLPLLRAGDEVKFVLAESGDYAFARGIVREGIIPRDVEVLFSPALPARNTPGTYHGVEPRWLAESILEDRLPVRMQLQLHKQLWGAEQRGV
jgi:7-carboxy-7-deazaguanine synthase